MADKPEQLLASLFDKLFQRQSLERNVYIVNQLKPNLEVPLLVIYKERKVQAITQDEKLILQALKSCTRVLVNDEKKTLQIRIEPNRSRLSVKSEDKNARQIVEKALKAELANADYRVEASEPGALSFEILFSSEQDSAKAASILSEEKTVKLHVEFVNQDPYQELRDNVDRIKRQKNSSYGSGYRNNNSQQYAPNSGYQGYNNCKITISNNNPMELKLGNIDGGYSNTLMNNPYGKMDRVRGPGYTRKAVESSDDEAPTVVVTQAPQPQLQPQPQIQQQPQTQSQTQPQSQPPTQSADKKLKYRQKNEEPASQQTPTTQAPHRSNLAPHTYTPSLSAAEVQKRTRLDSENFPSLVEEAKVQEKVLKHKYTKKDIVEIFAQIAADVKINKDLQKSAIPLINPNGNYQLEASKAGGRKESTFQMPVHILPVRKSSN